MSLRVWLILFVISMAASAEVLLWAVTHGQFQQINRGNAFPLRRRRSATKRRGTGPLLLILLGLGVMTVSFVGGMVKLLMEAYGK